MRAPLAAASARAIDDRGIDVRFDVRLAERRRLLRLEPVRERAASGDDRVADGIGDVVAAPSPATAGEENDADERDHGADESGEGDDDLAGRRLDEGWLGGSSGIGCRSLLIAGAGEERRSRDRQLASRSDRS